MWPWSSNHGRQWLTMVTLDRDKPCRAYRNGSILKKMFNHGHVFHIWPWLIKVGNGAIFQKHGHVLYIWPCLTIVDIGAIFQKHGKSWSNGHVLPWLHDHILYIWPWSTMTDRDAFFKKHCQQWSNYWSDLTIVSHCQFLTMVISIHTFSFETNVNFIWEFH